MENPLLSARQKRLSTHHNRSKRTQQQPVKVVYITNPMRFNTSVSEFKALVQELTGKHADYTPRSLVVSGGGREAEGDGGADAAVKAAKEGGSTVGDEQEELAAVGKMERPGNGGAWLEGSEPTVFGSGCEAFLEGIVDWNLLDVLQTLDAV